MAKHDRKTRRTGARPETILCVACNTQLKNSTRGYDRSWCDNIDCETVRIAWENARARHDKIPDSKREDLISPDAVLRRLREQQWRCARTGIQLQRCGTKYGTTHHNPASVSLDQIEPGKGYTESNVEIVVFQYNAAKGQLSREDGEKWILDIADGLRNRVNPGTPEAGAGDLSAD